MTATRVSTGTDEPVEVVDVVCPTGEHGGGEVIAGVFEKDGAKCACGADLMELEEARQRPELAEAVAAQDARIAAIKEGKEEQPS